MPAATLRKGAEDFAGRGSARFGPHTEPLLYFEFASILVFALSAIGFVVLNLFISRLLRPRSRPHGDKLEIYECGEPTVGQAWVRFDIRFYAVALMFVVFAVEVALLFPWAAIYRDFVERGLAAVALLEAGAFIAILMVGLAYVWARGDIEWTPEQGEEKRSPTDFAARAAVDLPRTAADLPAVAIGQTEGRHA